MRTYAERRLQKLQESVIRSITRYASEKAQFCRRRNGRTGLLPTPQIVTMAKVIGMPDTFYDWLRNFPGKTKRWRKSRGDSLD